MVVAVVLAALFLAASPARGWTDDPLVPGKTPIRALHVTEIQAAINAKLDSCGFGSLAFTQASAGSPIKPDDINSLRTGVVKLYIVVGAPPPSFTAPNPMTAGTPIRAKHMTELRDLVAAAGGDFCPSNCSLGSWKDGGCGNGGCAAASMLQTRAVSPSGCAAASQCAADASCACNYPASWSDAGCGGGSCADGETLRKKTPVAPSGPACATLTQCAASKACKRTACGAAAPRCAGKDHPFCCTDDPPYWICAPSESCF